MSVEYFYENDLNMLYNAAVNNNPDGGEHHTKMLESYNNLVAYISHIEHWKSTALQLAKNYGVRIHSLEQRIAELEQERRWIPISERLPEDTRIYDVAIVGYKYSWTGSCVFGKWIGESGRALLGITHWKYRSQPPQEEE